MKFEINRKKLEAGEHYCNKCNGYGWLQKDDENQKSVERCFDCSNGVVFECPTCGNILGHKYSYCSNKKCVERRKVLEEQIKFDTAKAKVNFKEAPTESIQCFYSPVFPYDGGFFENIDLLAYYCNKANIDMPKYVWGTVKEDFVVPSADDFLDQLLEEGDWLPENKRHIPEEAKDKLEKALDFLRENNNLNESYCADFDMCILLP